MALTRVSCPEDVEILVDLARADVSNKLIQSTEVLSLYSLFQNKYIEELSYLFWHIRWLLADAYKKYVFLITNQALFALAAT